MNTNLMERYKNGNFPRNKMLEQRWVGIDLWTGPVATRCRCLQRTKLTQIRCINFTVYVGHSDVSLHTSPWCSCSSSHYNENVACYKIKRITWVLLLVTRLLLKWLRYVTHIKYIDIDGNSFSLIWKFHYLLRKIK